LWTNAASPGRLAAGARSQFRIWKEKNMFNGKIGLPELLIVFAIGLLIFGPSKLAGLGKSLGEGIRGFKSAISDDESKKS
jgi:sec-independent protein translocase protein TatA